MFDVEGKSAEDVGELVTSCEVFGCDQRVITVVDVPEGYAQLDRADSEEGSLDGRPGSSDLADPSPGEPNLAGDLGV